MSALVLGPLLRYVGQTGATAFVETDEFSSVTVRCGGGAWTTPTFAAHGHHYAIVLIDGLQPATVQEYTVELDGVQVWPEADSEFPPSRIATLDPDVARRLVAVAARLYTVAAEEDAHPLAGTDVTPTESVVLATAALKAHDLNPFDLALWFSRSSS